MKRLIFLSIGTTLCTVLIIIVVFWQGHEIRRLEKSQLDGIGVLVQVLKIPEIREFSVEKSRRDYDSDGDGWRCVIGFHLFDIGNFVFGYGDSPVEAINDALRVYEEKRKEFCK